MRRLHPISIAAALCLAATISWVAPGEAASPTKNGLYEGPAKGSESRSDKKTVRIKVSGNGKTLNFRGPHESCGGFNPLSAFFPKIDKVKISKSGKFKGKREYKVTSPNGTVLNWKVDLSGRFTSASKAKGTTNYEMTVVDSDRGAPQDVPPKACGKRNVTWSAKRSR